MENEWVAFIDFGRISRILSKVRDDVLEREITHRTSARWGFRDDSRRARCVEKGREGLNPVLRFLLREKYIFENLLDTLPTFRWFLVLLL